MMFQQAKPLCPHCGGPLMSSTRGDQYCVQHGMFFAASTIEQGLGAPALAKAKALAAKGATCGRRCPNDRLALATFGNAKVTLEGCGRCGSVWLPKAELDKVVASTPPPPSAGTPAEARSLLGFAAVKSVLAAK